MGKSRTKKGPGPIALSGDLSDSMMEDEDSEDEEELDSDDQLISHSEDEQDMDDSGRLRMRPDISLGADYAGKRSSRKAAIGAGESDDDEDDDLENLGRKRLDDKLDALYTEGSSDEEDDALKKWQLNSGQDDELDALSREYEKLREQEVEVRETLKGEEGDNYRKGQAVQNQKALWDRALEIRISLQKSLSGANRLPKKQAKVALSENKDVREAYSRLASSAALTLNCLVDLETAMIESNSGIEEMYSSTANGNGKRNARRDPEEGNGSGGAHDDWENVDTVYSRIAPFRDNALDRWQRKVQLTTGVVSKGKLRAFNQSISQQISTAMRDTSRLLDGMRLKRSSLRVLGECADTEDHKAATDNAVEEVKEEEMNQETFDDSEFYQNLLHEFLESSDPMGQAGRDLIALKRRTKNRKVVDRRASKGRKIRYNVHEPLLNFMAPSPMLLPPMTDKLFANVFGQRKTEVSVAS
ncbi:protein AATF/BFR2 [Marchantia polymorpha subsp. ruderalis]